MDHTSLDDLLGIDPHDPAQQAAAQDVDEFVDLIETLVRIRKQNGLTQTEVADRMGTTQSAVSDIENIAGDPHISTIQRYARAVQARVRFTVTRDPGHTTVIATPKTAWLKIMPCHTATTVRAFAAPTEPSPPQAARPGATVVRQP